MSSPESGSSGRAEARHESFEVTADEAGNRLDRVMVARFGDDFSRTELTQLIKAGAARVSAQQVKAGYAVRFGEIVDIHWPEPQPSGIVPEKRDLEIVYEDATLLVVNKPAGLVVHPAAGHWTGTLVNALAAHVALPTGTDATKPGIVHRLDQDTSGLMVVAKTSRALRRLQKAFAARQVEKTYFAIVAGEPEPLSGRIERRLARSRRDRTRMQVVREGGRESTTLWRVVERFGGAALLRVELLTGRTHQIRVHLAHEGFPVVADAVYGVARPPGGLSKQIRAVLGLMERQALHAGALAFEHPDEGTQLRFEAPLPDDMRDLLKKLRAL